MIKDSFYFASKQVSINKYEKAFSYLESDSISVDFGGDKLKLDLSPFKNLIFLTGDYRNMLNLNTQTSLEYLYILNYDDESKEIEKLQFLKEFSNSLGKFTNLNFLKSQFLSFISIFGNKQLTDISGIKNHPTLKELDIESCKKIPADHLIDVVTSCKNLEVLKLSHFEFPNLEWVSDMKSLKQLVIIDCNVINGDISPAAHLEYVAIDNRKHYNYKFNSMTRTISPAEVKQKITNALGDQGKKKLLFELPIFGQINCNNLKRDISTDLVLNNNRINLELHFENESIAKSKLNRVTKLLENLEKDGKEIRQIFIKNFQENGVVKEYFDFYMEQNDDCNEESYWAKLSLKRIAFYPDDEDDYAIYDYVIDEIIPYVLALKINAKGKITDCQLES